MNRITGLTQKSAAAVTAMPPDVRRWLRPAVTCTVQSGYAPGSGLCSCVS